MQETIEIEDLEENPHCAGGQVLRSALSKVVSKVSGDKKGTDIRYLGPSRSIFF